jgi:hypothetical protein
MGKHAKSVDSQLLGRVRSKRRGWVFTPADFLDLGSRTAVGLALMRHARAGTIRQLARGLYDYPIHNPRIGIIPPSADSIANALKGRDDSRLQASGAHAANVLGLSTQVPVRTVFLTDSRSRKVKLGKREIVLKNTSSRQMATAGRISGTVIQALRWIGQRHIDKRMIASLRRRLSDSDKQQLLKDLRYAPAWIAEIMRKVAQPKKPEQT